MSEFNESFKPGFIARSDDPARAPPVEAAEFQRLVVEMDCILLPLLQSAANILEGAGFCTVRTQCRGGFGSLLVQCSRCDVDAWLRFHVHQTFAPLVSRDRIFWMYTLFKAGNRVLGEPGRLDDFTVTAALGAIVSNFISACIANS